MITTVFNRPKRYSPQTLIIFQDNSYYVGEVIEAEDSFPVANGNGALVNRHMVYQGKFTMGRPHGYGYFAAPGLRYYGPIANCNPLGECLERTK
jgi:hypothetical protein